MKRLSITLLCLLSLLFTANASYQFTYEKTSASAAKITGYTGTPSGQVVVPEKTTIDGKEYTVTEIVGSTFKKCTKITEVKLPNSVAKIGGSAFACCTSLEKINIPTSLEALAGYLFEECTSLSSIELPENILRVNEGAFKNCTSLKTVIIYNGTSLIPYNQETLTNCNSNLKVYVMPSLYKNYTSDSSWKTFNIVSLYTVTGLDSYSNGKVTADKEAYLPGSTAKITITPNAGYKISKVTINGTDVTSQVVNGVLSYSNISQDLKVAVTFENTLSYLVFKQTTDNYVSVGANKSTTIPSEIVIPSTTVIMGKEYTVNSVAEDGFRNCTGITSVVLPSTVTEINGSAFRNCSNLTTITIPSGVTAIKGNGFDGCTSLKTIELPESLVALAGYLFNGCNKLETVKLPANLDRINESAFYGCSSLKSIELPQTFKTLYDKVFEGCTQLTNITCKAVTPPTVQETTFSSYTYTKATLHVPASASAAYASHDVWKLFSKTDNSTPISRVIVDNQNTGKSYNLNGQEVDQNYRGIVIKNGRKYIKK